MHFEQWSKLKFHLFIFWKSEKTHHSISIFIGWINSQRFLFFFIWSDTSPFWVMVQFHFPPCGSFWNFIFFKKDAISKFDLFSKRVVFEICIFFQCPPLGWGGAEIVLIDFLQIFGKLKTLFFFLWDEIFRFGYQIHLLWAFPRL